MRSLEAQANYAGIKISGPPEIPRSFCPLELDDYILICNFNEGSPAKSYKYFNEVLSLLPPLNPVQLIIGDEQQMPNVHALKVTDIKKIAYLVDNCKILLSCDNYIVNLAADVCNKNVVALYGPYPPYLTAPKKLQNRHVLTENSEFTFSSTEELPTVNQITPSRIAEKVCNILNIEHKVPETVHLGQLWGTHEFHIVPDHLGAINNIIAIIRADLEFDRRYLIENTNKYKCDIVTDKAIDLSNLNKNNVKSIIYIFDKKPDVDFVKYLHRSEYDYNICVKNPNNDYKLDLMDYNQPVDYVSKREEYSDKIDNFKIDKDTIFHTCRRVFSKDGEFGSEWHFKNKVKENIVVDEPDFWSGYHHYWILNNK